MIAVEPFDPHAASSAEWAEFHAFRRRRAAEDDPGEPVLGDAEFEHGATRHWPLHEARRLLARRDGALIGSLGYSIRRPGTSDYDAHAAFVWAWGGVLAAARRAGVATALLRPLCDIMLAQDRTILTCNTREPDGHAFLAAIGAVEKLRTVENRLILVTLDWDELARWHAGAIAPGGNLRWEIHAGRVPMDRLATLQPQLTRLLADIPLGTLDVPPVRYEMQGWRTWYEEMDRHGGEHLLVLLMAGDTVAAMCEASWDARFPDRVFQALTAVARSWRGKGLAKAVKAAMLRLVRERHPGVRMAITSNAEVNAPILSINRRLGFAVHRHDGSYQITRDALANWLASRS